MNMIVCNIYYLDADTVAEDDKYPNFNTATDFRV